MIQLELRPEVGAEFAANAELEARLNGELQQGLREIAEGNTRPAREVFTELREEFGIQD